MPSEKAPERRQPLAIRLAIALMALVALSGIVMIGNGLYIMAKAEFSGAPLEHAAHHHLAEFRVIDADGLNRATEI
ncbi:hypothetical protein ABID16_000318 [Rhizobium aquaticum]|uniref:Uncharacterized protein n=1 Tax=Rhizobium aquaticum TaxID=1549636 RepID=A0ABV2IU48_9HYPH